MAAVKGVETRYTIQGGGLSRSAMLPRDQLQRKVSVSKKTIVVKIYDNSVVNDCIHFLRKQFRIYPLESFNNFIQNLFLTNFKYCTTGYNEDHGNHVTLLLQFAIMHPPAF